VNPYPQAVTAQMVRNFLQEGAAINVFCKQHQLALTVVDAGINHVWKPEEIHSRQFMDLKMGYGTANYLSQPAMTAADALLAIEKGKQVLQKLQDEGCNCVGFGEMGIGNTSSATLIMSAITGLSVQACTGRGTGTSDEQLQRKTAILEKVHALHQLSFFAKKPVDLLAKVGGFEIAMMTGAYLQAHAAGMIILVDGFIGTAALLIAYQLEPSVLNNCIFAHTSGEQGHEKMLQYLNVKPLLNLGLRLGEGTGAALAIPLVQSAVNFLHEMASFESAGVETKQEGTGI
jgi:nicotinate-nucleotide--dimethylbenzimidazole phosphoribosyltransferase